MNDAIDIPMGRLDAERYGMMIDILGADDARRLLELPTAHRLRLAQYLADSACEPGMRFTVAGLPG